MLTVLADQLSELQHPDEAYPKSGFFEDFSANGILGALEVVDLAAWETPMPGLWRSAPLHQQQPAFGHNRRAASDADMPCVAHIASAARMRAQDRAPLWNDWRSYFSFGE